MSMSEKDREVKHLDDLFDDLARDVPDPSADLIARVLADADSVQAGFATPAPARRAVPERVGLGARLFGFVAALGGAPVMAGLAVAMVTGVWIGANPPTALENGALALLGTSDTSYVLDLSPTTMFDVTEGGL